LQGSIIQMDNSPPSSPLFKWYSIKHKKENLSLFVCFSPFYLDFYLCLWFLFEKLL